MQGRSTIGAGAAEVTHLDLQLYRVPQAMRILSLRRSTIYELIRSGRLRSVREGRARLIPASAIAEYVALLKNEAQQ
jgi:excisionase family DNA binding protein